MKYLSGGIGIYYPQQWGVDIGIGISRGGSASASASASASVSVSSTYLPGLSHDELRP